MEASTAQDDAAMREDFQSLPPETQDEIFDLLQRMDPGSFDWWLAVLEGAMLESADFAADAL